MFPLKFITSKEDNKEDSTAKYTNAFSSDYNINIPFYIFILIKFISE